MGHVFSLQAIATCEQQGHEFAWVQTWHGLGFDECRRCGLTLSCWDSSLWAARSVLPGSTIDDAASVAPPSSWEPAAAATHYAGATDKPRRPGQPAKAARNEEIRRRRRAGESLASIAADFDLHVTRICQICKQTNQAAELAAATK